MMRLDSDSSVFKQMRDGDQYYVDKSLLIADLLDMDDRGVYLYIRPHGFGKTTNLAMLDAFFNIEYEGNSWFDGLATLTPENRDYFS